MAIKYVSGRVKELKVGISNYSEGKESLSIIGIVSATKYYGDGSNLTGTSTPGINTSSTSTFKDLSVTGVSTFTGAITANGDLDVDGYTELDDVNVSGASTFAGNINANGNIVGDNSTNITGIAGVTATTLAGTLQTAAQPNVTSLGTLSSLSVTGLSTFAGITTVTGHTLFTKQLSVSGLSTFAGNIIANGSIDLAGDIDVDGQTDLDVLNVSETATFAGDVDIADTIYHTGDSNTKIRFPANDTITFHTSGNEQFRIDSVGNVGVGTIDPTTKLDVRGDVNVSGASTFNGITAAGDITANGNIIGDNATNISGINSVTATTFYGSGSNLTGIDATALKDAAGNIKAQANPSGVVFTGIITGNGSGLTNINVPGISTSGTSIFENLTVNGYAGISTLNVTGISTFGGNLDIDADIDIDGQADLNNVNVSGVTTFTSDTNPQINISPTTATANGMIKYTGEKTFYIEGGTTSDNKIEIRGHQLNRNIVCEGQGETELYYNDNKKLETTSTGTVITGICSANGFSGAGGTAATFSNGVIVSVASTFNHSITINPIGANSSTLNIISQESSAAVGPTINLKRDDGAPQDDDYLGQINFIGDNSADQQVNYVQITGKISDVTDSTEDGILEFKHIKAGTETITAEFDTWGLKLLNSSGLSVAGVSTFASAKVSDLTSGRVVYAGAGGELQDHSGLTFNGSTLTAGAFAGDGSQLTNLPGIDTGGGSVFTNIFSSGINTLGKGASGVTYLHHADSLKFQTTGIGVSVSSGTAKTAYIEGPEEIWIDPHPAGVGTTSGIVRIRGDLYVDGTEFIVDVEKLELGDFQIGIASTAGTNAQLDGGGIGIGSVSIRKTITWNNATSALMCSENWNLGSGKHYEIAGTDVLTATTLGSGVVNSSLTSVGTLGKLTVGAGGVNVSGAVTATSFAGNGSALTNIVVTGINTGASSDFTDLVVSGNLNVTGITTLGGNIFLGDGTGDQINVAGQFISGLDPFGDNQFDLGTPGKYWRKGFFGDTVITNQINASGIVTAANFNSTSDIRLKDNIQTIEDPLAKLVQIEGVSFNWKENNKPALGVIADQVQEILPELVTDGDPKTVNYNGLIGLLIEAVKEQQIQIDELKSKLP